MDKKKFAEASGAGRQLSLFQKTRGFDPSQDIVGIHASPHRFRYFTRMSKGTSETPGISVSAYGYGSPHFLKIKQPYLGYGTKGVSLFPKIHLPTGPLFKLKEVFRLPKWLRGKDYATTSKYIRGQPKGPYAWIAPKSEMGGPEIEAIIRAGTWGRRTSSRFYTTYKGVVVPLPEDVCSSDLSHLVLVFLRVK